MESSHLFQKPVWHEPTGDILSLDGKTLLLTNPVVDSNNPHQGEQQELQIRVEHADPNSPESGKMAVKVWQTWVDGAEFSPVSIHKPAKAAQMHTWSRYLDMHALQGLKPAAQFNYYLVLHD